MIKAIGLTKYYRTQGQRCNVFENLSFELPDKGRLALIGPNGAGKSTLLRILCGIEKPNQGSVIRTSSLSWPVGEGKGFDKNLTPSENIKFICRLFQQSKQETASHISFVKDFCELGKHFDLPISTYSSGMKSRVSFAISMSFEFDFYVVDEAMSAGDARFKEKCSKIFDSRARDKGLIMVSHNMQTIEKFCTEGVFLNNGKVEYRKNIKSLIEMYNITGLNKKRRKHA